MKIDYNVDESIMKPVRPMAPPSEEVKAIMDFLESDKINIQFTYDTEDEARKRRIHITTQCRNRGLLIKTFQRGCVIIVGRKPAAPVESETAAE